MARVKAILWFSQELCDAAISGARTGMRESLQRLTLLISAWFLGRLHFFLPPALFLAVGAVGCKISPLIVKQRGS